MASYALTTSYAGESLLSGFNWFDGADPTRGYVSYQSRPNAEALGLYSVDERTGVVRLGVDSTNKYSLAAGRPSIRLESKEAFNHGLFIADFLHMPPSQCGLWPAFWSYGPNWPAGGEVDIIEGTNDQHSNLLSAHTAAGCNMNKGLRGQYSGVQREADCDVGNDNVGCAYSSRAGDTSAYGDGFNAANGGVYAMEWDDEFIKIWHFARSNIPKDITNKTPDTTGWGLPDAIFGGRGCSVDNFFKDMRLVININFCGDWGNADWGKPDGCGKYAATCNEYVANNPQAFANAYWDVRYIEAYRKIDVRSSSRSPSSSSTEAPRRVTMTTSITTTITIRRQPRTTSTGIDARNTTSVVSNVDATSYYKSAPEVATADTAPVYRVNSTSSSESARPTSLYRVNATSSYIPATEETVTSITPVYKLNTTSLLGPPHSSRIVNTTDVQLHTTSPLKSTGRSIPTNTTAIPRHTISSVLSVPSGTFKNTSQASIPQVASSLISIPSEVPGPKNPMQLGDFAYLGCYGSSDDFKTFRKVKDSKGMTINLCVGLCRDSMLAGVYDTQCFCADKIDANTRAANTKNGDVCDHPCPGNDAQYCGGLAKSPGKLSNTTSTAANERFENLASSTGVAASKSTATGQRFRNSTIARVAKNSTLATRFHVPSKRSPVSRMEKTILLTVYGVVNDETPPSPPPPMAGKNTTYTFTQYSTTVRVKTITVVPIQETPVGASKGNTIPDESPSGSPLADETDISTQGTSVPSDDKPVGDEDPGKITTTGDNSDTAKDGIVADRRPSSSHTADKTVDRVAETAAPSSIEFLMDKRPGDSAVGGKTVTKTVDQMEAVVEDCRCTEGEAHPTCSPRPPSSPSPPPPPSAERTNHNEPVPSGIEAPVPAEDSKHSQPVPPPAQATNARQPLPPNIEIPVPDEDPKNTQPAPRPAQATNPRQSLPSSIEIPVPNEGPKNTQPAPRPAQIIESGDTESSNDDSPAPVGTPGDVQHAPPSHAPPPPPPPPPPAQITQPHRVQPSGFETLPPIGNSQGAKAPKPSVVTAGTVRTWSRKPGLALGLMMLVVAMLL